MPRLRAKECLDVSAIDLGNEETKRNGKDCEEGANVHLQLFFRKLGGCSRVARNYNFGLVLVYVFFVVNEVQVSAHNDRNLRHDEVEGKVQATEFKRPPTMYQSRKVGDGLLFCVCIVWTGWNWGVCKSFNNPKITLTLFMILTRRATEMDPA